MLRGRVKEYNPIKGYGTLLTEDGREVFVHGSAIQAHGLKVLEAGQKVKFEIAEGPEGPLAANVRKMVDSSPEEDPLPVFPPSSGAAASPSPKAQDEEGLPKGILGSFHEEDPLSSSLFSLPRFDTDPAFARLRKLMGAIRLGSFSPPPVPPLEPLPQDYVSAEEETNLSSKGLDVEEGDVRLLKDGTLAYKNRRVVLYIRQPNSAYADGLDIDESWRAPRRALGTSDDSGPRFHIANCRTLEKMRQSGRGDRYVVSIRDDGQFEMVTAGGSVSIRSLRVCKNCLERLDWQGFVRVSGYDRDRRVDNFSLSEFFKAYGRTL